MITYYTACSVLYLSSHKLHKFHKTNPIVITHNQMLILLVWNYYPYILNCIYLMTDKSVGTLRVVINANIDDITTNNDKIISSIF